LTSVFIVDEEYHFAENVASALRFEGLSAQVFHDATEALDFFTTRSFSLDPKRLKLLIDVSLAPGEDLETFNPEITDEFFQTGLVLVEALIEKCPGLCLPSNTTLYTAHFKTDLWDRIDLFCTKHKFQKWQKSPDSSVGDVVKLVS
jgi:hypothetical protein